MCVDDDGGTLQSEEDGGVSTPPMAGSGARAGSGGSGTAGSRGIDAGGRPGGPADTCSCTANDDDKQGRVHVCTEGQTRAACEDFSCTLGRVDPDHACAHSDIRLCCVMKSRGLVSVLYDDCTQANCEPGFSEQCADFDGQLHSGDCASFGPHSDGSGGGGGCAVAGRNAPAAGDLTGLAFGVLGLLFARFSCRRPATRRRSSSSAAG